LGLLNADMGNESGKTDWLQKSLGYYSDIDATEKVTLIKQLLAKHEYELIISTSGTAH